MIAAERTLGARIKAANAALLVEGNLDAVTEFFAPDYVIQLTNGETAGGFDVIRRSLGMLHGAFPDLKVEVEILVEKGVRVAWQRTLRGVQQGAFYGFPATGRLIVWREMLTSRFQDGLIVEEWLVSDLAESLLRARKKA